MSKNTLNYEEKTQVITKYLNGDSFSNIAKEFDVTTKTIKEIVDNPEVRLQIEKKHLELSRAKESKRIDEIKEQMMDFISASLTEAMDSDKKISFLDKVKGMLDSIDRIARLNRGDVTDNTSHTEKKVNIDVAEIIKNLDSPEKKKEFLRGQLIVNAEIEE